MNCDAYQMKFVNHCHMMLTSQSQKANKKNCRQSSRICVMWYTLMQKLRLRCSSRHTKTSQDIDLKRYLSADNGTNFIVRRCRSAGDVGVTVAKATGAVEVQAGWSDGRTSHGGVMYRATQASRTYWREYMRRRELGESTDISIKVCINSTSFSL